MPKRKAKRVAKNPAASVVNDTNGISEEDAFVEQKVRSEITAIKRIRYMEIENVLTAIRFLKSYISNEHLQTLLLPFFKENLPNLTVSKTETDGPIEVKRKVNDDDLNTGNGGNMMSLFLKRMSMAYRDQSTAVQSLDGFEFSNKAGTTSFIGADNLQMKDFVLAEPSDTDILGMDNNMQTPGVTSQRLSTGKTPKTLRLPKQGEMLLSVHGSPLCFKKENNMDAINETEEELPTN